ncbi:MAG: MFS transporter [Acidimicrobiia bacterium]|nr:MFS transporter [Acidimicrobiia bacterium]
MRRIFLAVIAASTAGVLPVFLVGGLAVQIRDDLGLSPAAQGWVVFGYFAVSAASSAVLGRIVERLGPARGMRLAAVGGAASLAGAAASPGFGALLVALTLGGLANALAQPAANALIVAAVPPTRNGLAFGVKQSAIPAATLLAGLAVPTVGLTVGWRWAFAGAAALALVAAAIVPAVSTPARRAGQRSARPEAALGALAVLSIGAGLGAAMANSLGAFLTSAAVDAGLATGSAGALLSLASVVGLSSRLSLGWRADRRDGGHFRVVVVMLFVGSLGLVGLAVGARATIVAGALVAFGAGWAWPGVFNLAVVAYNRAAPAAATGITQTGAYAGGAIGPLVFGYVADQAGYSSAWLVFAAVAVAAAGVVALGNRLILADASARAALLPTG